MTTGATYEQLSEAKQQGFAEKLYILKGGVGHAGDANSWANMMFPPGTPVDIAANSHLIKHEKGWILFDCSTNDSIAKMPNGFGGAVNGIRWTKGPDETIEPQLEKIGITPKDIRYIGVSHEHADHTGNIYMFPNATALIQRREFDHAFKDGRSPAGPPSFQGQIFPRQYPVVLLDGDYDVFGDGSVVLYYVGGHTVGSQIALVRLRNSGYILLTGDAVHLKSNWDNRRVPRLQLANEENQWELSVYLAYQRMADLQAQYKADFWIHHDMEGYKTRKFAPDYYD